MDQAKNNIEQLVKGYITMFPDEFEQFKSYMNSRRSGLRTDYAETDQDDIMLRGLFEVPETLNTMFIMKLSSEDEKWLHSIEGGRWFANYFRVFASGNKV